MMDSERNQDRQKLLGGGKTNRRAVRMTKGISAAFLYVLLIVISGSCVQLLDRSIPDFELNAFRSAGALVIVFTIIIWNQRLPYVPKQEQPGLVLYIMNTIAITLEMYIGISIVPAAASQCTLVTVNIVSGIFLFWLCWNEKPTWSILVTSGMCIVGLLLVIQPHKLLEMEFDHFPSMDRDNVSFSTNFTTNSTMGSETEGYHSPERFIDILYFILPMAAGFGISLECLILKKNPYLTDHIMDVFFWCFLTNGVVSVLVMFTFETVVSTMDSHTIFLIMAHSTAYACILFIMMYAASNISGNTLNMIYCSSCVFYLLAQYTVLSSILPGYRNWMEVAGVIVVTLGSGLSSYVEVFQSEPELGINTSSK